MPIEWPTIVEGGIPILGGLYATALGYGVIGASPSPASPLKQKFLDRFRWLGPQNAGPGRSAGGERSADPQDGNLRVEKAR
jgi:hypothetical protein